MPPDAVTNGLVGWSVGEPTDFGNSEDCAHVYALSSVVDHNGNAHGINDRNCYSSLSYVCEFENFDELDIPSSSNQGKYMDDSVPVPRILEFSPFKDKIIIASVLLNLNVVTITLICYLGSKGSCCKSYASRYSKVNIYEKL